MTVDAITIPRNIDTFTATIAAEQTVSDIVDLNGLTAVAIELPAALTGTAITFQGTLSDAADATFKPIHLADGDAYSLTVAASRVVVLDPQVMTGFRRITVVSGSTEAAARSILVRGRVL